VGLIYYFQIVSTFNWSRKYTNGILVYITSKLYLSSTTYTENVDTGMVSFTFKLYLSSTLSNQVEFKEKVSFTFKLYLSSTYLPIIFLISDFLIGINEKILSINS